MESWPTLAHPLANKVGWFDVNNINCGLLGMPLGFLVMIVVSLHQGAIAGNAGACGRNPQAARQDGSRREDQLTGRAIKCGAGPAGPVSFWRIAAALFRGFRVARDVQDLND